MRLIDADELKEKISELIPRWNRKTDYGAGRVNSYEFVIKIIDNAQPVEQEVYMNSKDYNLYLEGYKQGKKDFERSKAKWIEKEDTPASVSYYCSNCEMEGIPVTPFCPWCGAEMHEEEE